MPKRLSDITHDYERTSEALEDAQDALISATEQARVRVDAAAQDRHRAYDALYRYLSEHHDEVVVSGDWAYRAERGQISRSKVTWAHHQWCEDAEPPPSYRVPTTMAALTAAWDMGTEEEDEEEYEHPPFAALMGIPDPRTGQAATLHVSDDTPITMGSQEDSS